MAREEHSEQAGFKFSPKWQGASRVKVRGSSKGKGRSGERAKHRPSPERLPAPLKRREPGEGWQEVRPEAETVASGSRTSDLILWVVRRDWKVVGKVALAEIFVVEMCPLPLPGDQPVREHGWQWKDQLGDLCRSLSERRWWLG